MGEPQPIDAKPKARKAAANRGAYLAERDGKDRILLRLDKGMAARIDAARAVLGLSRSSFVMLRLSAVLGAPDLDSRTRADVSRPASLETVADEFDELFASGSP